jgi:hypothetical protein
MVCGEAKLSGAGEAGVEASGAAEGVALFGSGAEASAATGFVGMTIGAGEMVSMASASDMPRLSAASKATGAADAPRREP